MPKTITVEVIVPDEMIERLRSLDEQMEKNGDYRENAPDGFDAKLQEFVANDVYLALDALDPVSYRYGTTGTTSLTESLVSIYPFATGYPIN